MTVETYSISNTKVKLRYREKYITEGVNEKSMALPRGCYRGFIPRESAVPDQSIHLDIDPLGLGMDEDSFAVFTEFNDGSPTYDGWTLSVRESASVELEVTDPALMPIPAGVYYLYVYMTASYEIGTDTTAIYSVSDEDPYDSGSSNYDPDVILVGRIPVTPAATTITFDITNTAIYADVMAVRKTPQATAYKELSSFGVGDDYWGMVSGIERWSIPDVDQKDAMDAASSPSATNPFLTATEPHIVPTLYVDGYSGQTDSYLICRDSSLNSLVDIDSTGAMDLDSDSTVAYHLYVHGLVTTSGGYYYGLSNVHTVTDGSGGETTYGLFNSVTQNWSAGAIDNLIGADLRTDFYDGVSADLVVAVLATGSVTKGTVTDLVGYDAIVSVGSGATVADAYGVRSIATNSGTVSGEIYGFWGEGATSNYFEGGVNRFLYDASSYISIETYDSFVSASSSLDLKKSANATLAGMTQTRNLERLGNVNFYGVNNASAWTLGAWIYAEQVGSATTSIPASLVIGNYADSYGMTMDYQGVFSFHGGSGGPESWYQSSIWWAFEFGEVSCMYVPQSSAALPTEHIHNAYSDTAGNYKYRKDGGASRFELAQAGFEWDIASSGASGNDINGSGSWTTIAAMNDVGFLNLGASSSLGGFSTGVKSETVSGAAQTVSVEDVSILAVTCSGTSNGISILDKGVHGQWLIVQNVTGSSGNSFILGAVSGNIVIPGTATGWVIDEDDGVLLWFDGTDWWVVARTTG